MAVGSCPSLDTAYDRWSALLLRAKVRGGGALEVKAFLGSPGSSISPVASGRMQYWQKWSFPRPGTEG
jgi:hypothetical protein